MRRAQALACRDAGCRGCPRKVKEFFQNEEEKGVCELCGHGLGKYYARVERIDHQRSEQHLRNMVWYRSAFQEEKEELYVQQQFIELKRLKDEGKRVASSKVATKAMACELVHKFGASAWIAHGDTTTLKAALFDVMMDGRRSAVFSALRLHCKQMRLILLRRAIVVALGGNADAAFLCASLCAPHVDE